MVIKLYIKFDTLFMHTFNVLSIVMIFVLQHRTWSNFPLILGWGLLFTMLMYITQKMLLFWPPKSSWNNDWLFSYIVQNIGHGIILFFSFKIHHLLKAERVVGPPSTFPSQFSFFYIIKCLDQLPNLFHLFTKTHN